MYNVPVKYLLINRFPIVQDIHISIIATSVFEEEILNFYSRICYTFNITRFV